MNNKNSNKELGFDVFSQCDYNLHWSFSNFNRILIAAGQIAKLPLHAKVLELGAGTSELSAMVKDNFKRGDIQFVKVDSDKCYLSDDSIIVMDITKVDKWPSALGRYMGHFDCVVYMEVIEHLAKVDAKKTVASIYSWLKSDGILLLTTPTPPKEAMYENQVWATDHKEEFTFWEIYDMLNVNFKITKTIGWSLEEREFNKLLENNSLIQKVYCKLREAFPDSYIRAIMACLADDTHCRQTFMICKKRRVANGQSMPNILEGVVCTNGRFTQT